MTGWQSQLYLSWLAWTAVALVFTLYVMLPSPAAGDPWEWVRATAWQLVGWWSWAALTPAVVAVTRRAMHIRSPVRLLAIHLAAGVAIAGLCAAVQGFLQWAAFGGVRARYDVVGASSMALADHWSFNLVVYGLVVGVVYGLRAWRLEGELARARLDTLTARLRPHFLFNALNTVSALVLEDPKAANRMITGLSELLRNALESGLDSVVALEEELQLLQQYVAIQQERFGDRLCVRIETGPGVERALVPSLLLQPLVENAITHGLRGQERNGTVTVRVDARRRGDRLRIVVEDTGPGFMSPTVSGGGVGLAGTRARLSTAYGSAARLELNNSPSGGAVVLIEMPLTTGRGTTA